MRRARAGLLLLALGLVLAGWCGWIARRIATSAPRFSGQADAAVVLGSYTWRGQPSDMFIRRIEAALELHRAGRVRRVIFTGGRTVGEGISNAEAARDYALARGLPAADILLEPDSRTTVENLVYAGLVGQSAGLRSYVVVSDDWHLFRALRMAKDHLPGAQGHGVAGSPGPFRRAMLRRELYFYGQYVVNTQFRALPSPTEARNGRRPAG